MNTSPISGASSNHIDGDDHIGIDDVGDDHDNNEVVSPTTGGGTGSGGGDTRESKTSTFRRRRLSLPLHHITGDEKTTETGKVITSNTNERVRTISENSRLHHNHTQEANQSTQYNAQEYQSDEPKDKKSIDGNNVVVVVPKQFNPFGGSGKGDRSNDGNINQQGTEEEEEDYGYEPHEPGVNYEYEEAGNDTNSYHHHNSNNSMGVVVVDDIGGDNHSIHSTQLSVHSSSDVDEKAQTFRKRRLSITTTTSTNSNSGNNNVSINSTGSGGTPTQQTLVVAPDSSPPNHYQQHHQHNLASRKRPRRLSHDSSVCSASSLNSENMFAIGGGNGALQLSPSSGAAATKGRHSGGGQPRFISRTLHSGELVAYHEGIPPPSPAVNSNNVLYHQNPLPPIEHLLMAHQQQQQQQEQEKQQENSSSGYQQPPLDGVDVAGVSLPSSNGVNALHLPFRPALGGDGSSPATMQPRWKRRKTLCHQTEPHKLPFQVDVVGTYSCHGVEPFYDSEYDDEEEDDGRTGNGGTVLPAITMAAKINQDRGGVAYPYGNHPRTALFAVYDGHGQGGELVSQYALYEIQRRLEKHPSFRSDLSVAMRETFLAVDEALIHEPLIDPLFAGTTACVAVYHNNTLTLANAGDSRAVCARRVKRPQHNKDQEEEFEYIALDLTQDQNPDVPAEMERIIRMGGYVSLPPAPGLSARVWLDPHCSQIGLAMARSIGDHAVAPAGVIAEPVVTTHEVTSSDDFLILASDGVWEFISSSQAVQLIADNLHRGATKACQALIEAAAARWHEEEGAYRDDITAIVVRLQQVWDATTTSTTTTVTSSNNNNSSTTATNDDEKK